MMCMLDATVTMALGLLVVIPVGLGIATLIYERKVNREHDEFMESQERVIQIVLEDCSECCGCHCCVEREECGCCGKPLDECECNCGCGRHN